MTFLCRYPGGKAKLARPIMERLNECNVNDYREPFVGGGAIALRMMTSSSASCWINDIDHTVHALWLAIASHADDLKQAVREFQPSVEEFRRIKAGFLSNGPILATDVVRIALDKLAIQAMSFSGLGVMSNAPVGGWSQRNSNVGSRWLPETLCKRIDLISPHLARARGPTRISAACCAMMVARPSILIRLITVRGPTLSALVRTCRSSSVA